jgi:predicted anti-sigma-YlaC factor YlaD
MHCRNAKQWLSAQCDHDLAQSDVKALQEHLQECSGCRAFQKHQACLDTVFCNQAPRIQTRISTEKIMLAIQQQKRITQQLEDLRTQQQSRMERWRTVGAACIALGFFTLSSIPLLLLAILITQTDFMVKVLLLLNDVIDMFVILAQYLQIGLTLVTRDNGLLSAIAFAVVVMMGMWLRLMRHPRRA